jgi:hypothetical protein
MYENWTKAEKLRWSLTWLIGTVSYVVIALSLDSYLGRHFPTVDSHTTIAIETGIAVPLAALLTLGAYRVVITKILPDQKGPP